jgi:hypothetical protein
MSFQTGSIDKNGLARTEDGKLYVTSVGTASITGGTINSIDVTKFVQGTYTPTLTNVANLDSSTALVCQYMRFGDVVVVSGGVTIDPTSATTQTTLRISLPIASNFAAVNDCGGAAANNTVAGASGAVYADTTNDAALLQFLNGSNTASATYFFTFMYRVI